MNVRIVHSKDGQIWIEMDGKRYELPPKGQDLVITPKYTRWQARTEYNASREAL